MDTRFNIINDQQDLTEINFLLGDNQPGERGSFKIGDFFKTSWLEEYTFRIENFGFNTNQAGLSVPTDIYFNMWKGGDDWGSTSLTRDISPGEDFLKTMEKTAKPQSGGKTRRKKRIFRYNVMTLRKHRKSRKRKSRKSRKRKSGKSRKRKSRRSRRRRRKSRRKRRKSRRKRRKSRRKRRGGSYKSWRTIEEGQTLEDLDQDELVAILV